MFFLQAFATAARSPNAEKLKWIYSMLSGPCRDLIRAIPDNELRAFDKQLMGHLKKAKLGNDTDWMVSLIGVRLIISYTRKQLGLQSMTNYHDHLEGAGAIKAIDTLTYAVIEAYGDNVISEEDIVARIEKASSVAEHLDKQWRAGPIQDKKVWFAKLIEKLQRPHKSIAVQAAVCFHTSKFKPTR
jgi:hypothetical protein